MRIGFFRCEEKIFGDLLGDRRSALCFFALEDIGPCGARYAEKIDTAMLVKFFVLGGQNGPFHDVGDFLNADHGAALLPEFSDEETVRRKDLERNFGLIVRQDVERRQLGVNLRDDDNDHRHGHQKQSGQENERVNNPAGNDMQCSI